MSGGINMSGHWGEPEDLKKIAKDVIEDIWKSEALDDRVNFTVTVDETTNRRLQILLKMLGMSRVEFCGIAIQNLILAFESELKLYDLSSTEGLINSEYFRAVNLNTKEDFEKYLKDMPAGLGVKNEVTVTSYGGFVYKDGKVVINNGTKEV